jgi:hypothetical protein
MISVFAGGMPAVRIAAVSAALSENQTETGISSSNGWKNYENRFG